MPLLHTVQVNQEWIFHYNGILPKLPSDANHNDTSTKLAEAAHRHQQLRNKTPMQVVLPNQTPMMAMPLHRLQQIKPDSDPINRNQKSEHQEQDQGGIPTQHNHLILVPLSREHEEGTVHMYNERPTFIWIDRLKWRNLLIIAFAIHALFLLYDIVAMLQYTHNKPATVLNAFTILSYCIAGHGALHQELMSLTWAMHMARLNSVYYLFILYQPIHVILIFCALVVFWVSKSYRERLMSSWFVVDGTHD